MAHSGSVKRSQDILACGLCETNTKIKVKCMDCDLYMCQKCTDKIHAKFKNADLHDIVALKDIHSHTDDTDAESDFKPVKCKDHRKQLCCMFCITCDLLVCPMCIAKTHQQHLMEEIQTVCQQKVAEMKNLQNRACFQIEKVTENLNRMEVIEKSRSAEIEQNLLKEKKQAEEVQLKCLQLLEEHTEMTKRFAKLMLNKEAVILEQKKDIELAMQQIENIHKSQNTEKLLEAVRNLRTNLHSIEQLTCSKLINIKVQQYLPDSKFRNNSKLIEKEIEFEIKEKYETGLSYINSITSDQDGNLWITDGMKQIQQLKVKEGIKPLKSIENESIFNEIRCLNQDVVFTSPGSKKIHHLPIKGKINLFKDLSPCVPFTLHVSDTEIIVGMNCSTVEDKMDVLIIMRFGFNGKTIQVYKNHGKEFLTRDVVRSCTAINNGAICYVDSSTQGECLGDVVFISREGIIQWKYSGNSFSKSNEKPFTPVEVLSTKCKNFIVSDKKEQALHILTEQGELLTILSITSIGQPEVMTIDVYGILWIGSKEKNKGILYPVKFSGF